MLAFATIVSLIAAACAGAASSSVPSLTPASPSSSTPSETATALAELVVGGDRPVTVHLPASYDAVRPAPLVILLHGYGSSGLGTDAYFRLARAADARGYVYAYPDGTIDSNYNRFWNATDACCNFDKADVDDVAYLAGVVAEIQAKLAIDPKRIALVGHSNGGFMSYRMACDRAGLVGAIVSLAAASFADPADCAPSEPVSVAQIHGTDDDVVRYKGDRGTDRSYPGAEATAEAWAAYDGCREAPSQFSATVDVDGVLTDGTDPAETWVAEWSGCRSGATVQLWTIPNGGHAPVITASFADAVMDFLVDHPKP
jgi:polyhydroxybutyrate depolymerase